MVQDADYSPDIEDDPDAVDPSEPVEDIGATPDDPPDTPAPLDLTGTDTSDILRGDEGDDTLRGGGGPDALYSAAGDDLVHGDAGNDLAHGGSGADTLFGGDGNDRFFGDSGRIGTSSDADGDDVIDGGAGNDSLYGGGGIDTLSGGDGDDRIWDYDLSSNEGRDNGSVVDGGAGDDDIRVDAGSKITGGAGNDSLYVHADIGDEGVTDITDFTRGEDRLAFDIVIDASDAGQPSVRDMADGTGAEVYMGDVLVARITGGQGLTLDDLDINIVVEQNAGPLDYAGSDAADVIVGNHFDNVMDGEGGNDSLFAGTGNGYLNNFINYHGGSDVLNGGAGDDYLVAEGGTYTAYNTGSSPITVLRDLHVDTLNGGAGDDTLIATNGGNLTGGAGADVFVVNQNMRYIDTGDYAGDALIPEPILITDFNPDEDVIVIDRLGDFAGFSGPDSSQVTVAARADGQGSDILIEGQVIATVVGSNTLSYADLSFDGDLARP